MAKKTSTKTPKQGKLAGKKVAFVGKFGHADWWRKDVLAWAKAANATVVAPAKTFDILVVGDGRGGKPPGDVAKIRKRLPAVQEVTMAEFAQLASPDPDQF